MGRDWLGRARLCGGSTLAGVVEGAEPIATDTLFYYDCRSLVFAGSGTAGGSAAGRVGGGASARPRLPSVGSRSSAHKQRHAGCGSYCLNLCVCVRCKFDGCAGLWLDLHREVVFFL